MLRRGKLQSVVFVIVYLLFLFGKKYEKHSFDGEVRFSER